MVAAIITKKDNIIISPPALSQQSEARYCSDSKVTTATFIRWWKGCGKRPHSPVAEPLTAAETRSLSPLDHSDGCDSTAQLLRYIVPRLGGSTSPLSLYNNNNYYYYYLFNFIFSRGRKILLLLYTIPNNAFDNIAI